MPSAVVQSHSTIGTLGVWGGTKDDKPGYIDHATGETNINPLRTIEIVARDLRSMEKSPTLLENGYEHVKIPTTITTEQFLDKTPEGKEYLQDLYFKECQKIVHGVTKGAAVIIPTSFRIREESEEQKELGVKAGPSAKFSPRPVAHVDRDTTTFITLLKETVGEQRAAALLEKHTHFAQVNVWRPIGAPATKWPLCFMNHERIPNWDCSTHTDRIYSHNDPRVAERGEKVYDLVATFDERYDYHYVSNLAPEECLVFCPYDNDPNLIIPHSVCTKFLTALRHH